MKLKENWYAFYLCLMKNISIDRSLIKMAVVFKQYKPHANPKASKYSQQDITNIINLKNRGKSYKEIGIILGMTRDQVAGVARMYKQKTARTPAKVVQAAI